MLDRSMAPKHYLAPESTPRHLSAPKDLTLCRCNGEESYTLGITSTTFRQGDHINCTITQLSYMYWQRFNHDIS